MPPPHGRDGLLTRTISVIKANMKLNPEDLGKSLISRSNITRFLWLFPCLMLGPSVSPPSTNQKANQSAKRFAKPDTFMIHRSPLFSISPSIWSLFPVFQGSAVIFAEHSASYAGRARLAPSPWKYSIE
jgi:hypothetical protein